MAKSQNLLSETFIANGDLSANIYYAVTKDTSGNKVVISADGDPVLGVLQNKPLDTEGALVRVYGITPMVTGSAGVSEGDLVASDSTGAAITATSGDYVLGICLDGGNYATGKMATVFLTPGANGGKLA